MKDQFDLSAVVFLGQEGNNMTNQSDRTGTFLGCNCEDQWSETERKLRSREYQHLLAVYFVTLMEQSTTINSIDDLLDIIIDEVTILNKADLFDMNRMYLDPEMRTILDVLKDDTRHQMGRLLAKAARLPKRRLQRSLVEFYMFCDLAMKCREARRRAGRNWTAV